MSVAVQRARTRQIVCGIAWLVLGLGSFVLTRLIQKPGFASSLDPGPQFFPFMLGICLVLGGCGLLAGPFLGRSSSTRVPVPPENDSHRSGSFLAFLGALMALLILLPWLGFSLACFLFASWMLWTQGSRWYVCLLISAALITGIQLLFGRLFHVQLPAGVLGLPF